MIGRRRHQRIAHDDERLRHDDADIARLSGLRNIDAAEHLAVADVVGCIAVRRRPFERALVEIDADNDAVRRFEDRQTLHDRPRATEAFAAAGAAAPARRTAAAFSAATGGWRWRRSSRSA